MAIKQKRAAEMWRWVHPSERELPIEQQTTFVLRPLTQVERLEARDNMARLIAQPDGSTATITRTHRSSFDLCLGNIAAVENFPAGDPTPWPDDRESRIAYLDQMDDELVKAVGNEIWAHAWLGGDAKNS